MMKLDVGLTFPPLSFKSLTHIQRKIVWSSILFSDFGAMTDAGVCESIVGPVVMTKYDVLRALVVRVEMQQRFMELKVSRA